MTILGLTPSSIPMRPAHFHIKRVIRPNIVALHPHRGARDDDSSGILLDGDSNALGHSISPSDNTSLATTTARAATAMVLQINGNPIPVDAELDLVLSLDPHRTHIHPIRILGAALQDYEACLPQTMSSSVSDRTRSPIFPGTSPRAPRGQEYSCLAWSMRASKRRRGRQGQP